jgi:hypothetical protein
MGNEENQIPQTTPDYSSVESDVMKYLEQQNDMSTPMQGSEDNQMPVSNEPIPQQQPIVQIEPTPQVDPMADNPYFKALADQNAQFQQAMLQQSQNMEKLLQNNYLKQEEKKDLPQEKTPEEIEAENADMIEQFMSNPRDFLNKFVEQTVTPYKQEIDSYKDKMDWDNNVAQFTANTPDFNDLRGRVVEIINERPYLLQSGDKQQVLKDAYLLAKSETVQAPQPQLNPTDILKDQTFVQQNILGNPEVMKMIAQMQATQIKTNSQQVPPMAASSGVSNAAPYIKQAPRNYDEVENEVLSYLKQQGGK